jgi:hypothetical protein
MVKFKAKDPDSVWTDKWRDFVLCTDGDAQVRCNIESTHFKNYIFDINGTIFNEHSAEFEEALDQEFTWRALATI